jgi:hypothetical protein
MGPISSAARPQSGQTAYFSTTILCIGFKAFAAVVMKSSIFWDMTSCIPFKVDRYFGGICRLSIQGWRVIQAIYQHEVGSKPASCWFPVWLNFNPEDGGDIFPGNIDWLSTYYTALYSRRYNCTPYCMFISHYPHVYCMPCPSNFP